MLLLHRYISGNQIIILQLVLQVINSALNSTPANIVQAFSLSSSPSSSKLKLNTFNVKKVTKVTPSEFDVYKHYFHSGSQTNNDSKSNSGNEDNQLNTNIYETPVLIENALSSTLCEDICDSIVYNLGSVQVDLQRKRKVSNDDNILDGGQ